MAKIHDKFAATAFKGQTSLTFQELLVAADDAASRSAGLITKVVRDQVDQQRGYISFRVKKAGVATVGDFAVTYATTEGAAGIGTVTFVPGSFVTSQAKVLFIPIGPADSAALKSFQTFSKLLQASAVKDPVS
ncbi:MAG: hypothetical protein ABWX74_13860 [Aeromicrobium sp.]